MRQALASDKYAFEAGRIEHFQAKPVFGGLEEKILTGRDYDRARSEITAWEGYRPTPLHSLDALAGTCGLGSILYKDEGSRFGLGSFKALGGAYAACRLLAREVGRKLGKPVTLEDIRLRRYADEASAVTLVSATDGNHGRSLSWGAQQFGARCVIYIHAEVSEGRAEAMRNLGAEIVRISGDYDDSVAQARADAEKNGWFVVSDTSWEGYTEPPRDVMAGYGVMFDEIAAEMPEPPTHVLLQGGVGGLAASALARFRQLWGERAPRGIVVEPDLAPCLLESAKAGAAKVVTIESETLMAGLSCGEPSALGWPILADLASDFLAISDDHVAPAMRLLARPSGDDPAVEAGESGVAGIAALIAACKDEGLMAALGLDENSRVLAIGTEGITDQAIYDRLVGGEAI
ncbi:diaminopropionate ammonia-lyase [Stappia sp. GBMRC 2046]|uniref:Diaminopropionate ammonia-lyase n=1 Tax=Stappia sediminis TaxID=2692190 RepID=A0A7X3LXX3_9HYPH|nr:diaminopropionate ammonia-lyase [Stappia sediminis]MXN67204.1 diaminopropionate ammonia-lyase [Stappia sediminis]